MVHDIKFKQTLWIIADNEIHEVGVDYVTRDDNNNIDTVRVYDRAIHEAIIVTLADLYEDKNDAKTELYRRSFEKMQAYKTEIQNIEDLVRFGYTHHIALGSETDLEARMAYQIRAEALGINLRN